MDFGGIERHDRLGGGLLGGAAGAVQPAGAVRPLLPHPRQGGRPARRAGCRWRRGSTRPPQVGADRLVNTVGAHDRYGGDLIVVDFGTATTFDVVDNDGAYVGGVIAPGVNLSLKALHDAAAALPFIDVTKPERGRRHQHRRLHAVGHLLGLRRAGRGHVRAHPRRAGARR